MKENITMIYFDLDHTLWDFESNSEEALKLVYEQYHDILKNVTLEDFINSYHKINKQLWDIYRKKMITQEELKVLRFEITLNSLNVKHRENLVEEMNDFYLNSLSNQSKLIDGAKDILDYLKSDYELGIITNGFKNTQIAKMKNSGIDCYFSILVTSDETGFPKPDEKIFSYAVYKAARPKEEIVYVGDDLENDILPALKFGINAIWFKNHDVINSNLIDEKDIVKINHLSELKEFF